MSMFLPPDEAQLECIKKEDVYRSAAELEEDVSQLILWLSKQPHLPNVTDRKWLLHFITGCKYSLQRAKQVIESHFIARAEIPESFGSFTSKEYEELSKNGKLFVLPKLTPEGYRVCFSRSCPSTGEEKLNVAQLSKLFVTMLILQLKEEPMYGNVFLYDLKYFHMSQFLAFTPTSTKNMIRCCINSFPLRVKSIHFVNPPKFIGNVVAFFKMFLPAKIKNRLFVHNSLESLYQYVPRDILPEAYGGLSGSVEKYEENTYELLMSNKEWLDSQPKADLSKLPRHLKSDDLGVNGTFKKLQID